MYQPYPNCGLSIPLVPEEKGSTIGYCCFWAIGNLSDDCSKQLAFDRTDRDLDIADRAGISAGGFGSCAGGALCSFPMVEERW